MGGEIDECGFTAADFRAFAAALKAETAMLGEWIAAGRLDTGPARLGAEVEAWLVDAAARPCPVNQAVIDGLGDDRVVPELARFNLELNTAPRALTGEPFGGLRAELDEVMARVNTVAGTLGARLVTVGILPTVTDADLGLTQMSPLRRYQALNEQVLLLRNRRPLQLQIDGRESVYWRQADVMLEAAATSLQVHLQVSPTQAARFYNAAVAVSAATVAIAANAPGLFGRLLWEETRVPLFEQAVEIGPLNRGHAGRLARVTFGPGYVQEGLHELFVANRRHYPVILPVRHREPPERLAHLMLHNGTIWRWNRPLVGFDDAGRCHLRLEHRVMSAGPTACDMAANAAFFIGVAHGLMDRAEPIESCLPFDVAEENFYAAAREGLAATVTWPGGECRLDRLILQELLPIARHGLDRCGAAATEIDEYLDIVEARVATARTGSAWQRAWLAAHGRDPAGLVEAYVQRQTRGEPVHRWQT